MSAARQLLDRAHSPAQIDALDAGAYAAALAEEIPATFAALDELESRDAALVAALEHVDATIARVMRTRLEHALADDVSIAPKTRNVFASTIVAYENQRGLFEQRVRDVAARGGARDPDQVVAAVVAAVNSVLALRAALRDGVLALVRTRASASIDQANRRARDRTNDDAQRRRWSAVRRELEALAADPGRIATASLAARLAAWPEQLDEPAPEQEATFADMIEID